MANRLDILHGRLIEHGLSEFFDKTKAINQNLVSPWTKDFKATVKPYDQREIIQALSILLNGLLLATLVFVLELLCKRFGWKQFWTRIETRFRIRLRALKT